MITLSLTTAAFLILFKLCMISFVSYLVIMLGQARTALAKSRMDAKRWQTLYEDEHKTRSGLSEVKQASDILADPVLLLEKISSLRQESA